MLHSYSIATPTNTPDPNSPANRKNQHTNNHPLSLQPNCPNNFNSSTSTNPHTNYSRLQLTTPKTTKRQSQQMSQTPTLTRALRLHRTLHPAPASPHTIRRVFLRAPYKIPSSPLPSSFLSAPRNHIQTRNMSSAPSKKEFLCILPDKPGAQAKRLEVRP